MSRNLGFWRFTVSDLNHLRLSMNFHSFIDFFFMVILVFDVIVISLMLLLVVIVMLMSDSNIYDGFLP